MSACSFFVNDMNGILVINKPAGMTSFDVVHQVKKRFQTKKVGHCGTLDPLATGVLVVCVNKATKLVPILTSDHKVYETTLTFGTETTTLDLEGDVIKKAPVPVLNDEIINTLFKQFTGDLIQEPPIYSAIKVDGKKLYEYAREQKQVVIPKREVCVHQIECLSFNETSITFRVHVSKGTYIRSLCRDMAYALDSVGTMTCLKRIQSGPFTLAQSVTLDELSVDHLLSVEEALAHLPKIVVEDETIVFHGKLINHSAKGIQIVYNKYGKALAIYKQIGNDTLKCVRGIW